LEEGFVFGIGDVAAEGGFVSPAPNCFGGFLGSGETVEDYFFDFLLLENFENCGGDFVGLATVDDQVIVVKFSKFCVFCQ